MKSPIIQIALIPLLLLTAMADEKAADAAAIPVKAQVASWKRHCLDIETGMIWNVGSNTPIAYRIVPTQITWRSPYVWKKNFNGGSKILFRNQISLIADWVQNGPEDYYIGFSGAPSVEWWAADDKWSVYASVGGGFGVTNSTDVPGGQGQDFTYNWFAKGGLRYQFDQDFGIYGGAFFQHLSNRGATDPNPGIDALGFTMGVSFTF
ncbi:MAG: acyloxyacyl hydrolase [Verrucomicrobiae bacterium]|nr:acyloxyacyl hydrolase [Verrucomicrobiae bacterium]NNJ87492.1 acyloxyacyl hydrolase [Akkermansiaceae bacterium]